jgi:hypothetical protein
MERKTSKEKGDFRGEYWRRNIGKISKKRVKNGNSSKENRTKEK